MSRKYKFLDQSKLYFVSFATVHWIDIFTRELYKTILLDSLKFCQANKGLEIFAWCIMTNHVHLIIGTKGCRPSQFNGARSDSGEDELASESKQ